MCLSSSWLNSLWKLDQYRDISYSGRVIFLNFFGDSPGMFLHYFQIITNFMYVFQAVSWFTSLEKLGLYRKISGSG